MDAPHTIGDTVTDDTYAGMSGRSMSITKTAAGEWDIMFPGDWDWLKMGASSTSTPLQRNVYIQYYPGNVQDWKTLQPPVWSSGSYMGIRNKAHVIVPDGVYDLTYSSSDYVSIYPRSTVKGLISTVPDGARGSKATYRIHMNTMALDLNPDGDTVSIRDVMDVPDNSSAQLMDVAVWVTTMKSDRAANVSDNIYGSPWYNPTRFATKSEYRLDPSSYTTTYDPATHTLTLDGLPDGHQLAIEYHLRMNSVEDSIKNVKNTATPMAGDTPTPLIDPATATSTIKIYESGAVIKISGIYLNKLDADDHSKTLADATFRLDRWNGSEWEETRSVTTGNDGAATVDKLECGRAYRLVETQAPTAYVLDDTAHNLYLTGCTIDPNVDETTLKPAGWAGQAMIPMDVLTVTNELLKVRLPDAGGNGIVLWLIAGLGALMLLGALRLGDSAYRWHRRLSRMS